MAGTHNQRTFLDDHFLLDNEIAVELFHVYAKEQPIIDYHSHLPPEDIAQNRQFENLTQIWLNGDHYKWRAMRTLGIEEQYITGGATDQDKFLAWAKTVPYTMRNPLFHWTHLELKRYFDIDTLLNPKTAVTIFAEANELLGTDPYRTQGLLQKMKVEVVCTTDDPVDDLDSHRQMAANEGAPIRVLPTFRPDKAIQIMQDHFPDYITTLGEAAHIEIAGLDDLFEALSKRVAYFADHGCALSDHGMEHIPFTAYTHKEVDVIFKRRLQGQALDTRENAQFQTALLVFLGTLYAEKNWTMQLHLGAMRNNSQRMKRTLGPDTGFDSIGDYPQAVGLSRFLDQLDEQDTLPKTIVYNLNPRDNEVMATLVGNFNDGTLRGKMQWGSAWWFLDQKDGMQKQLNALSNMGLLSCFVGMLTDSRSFLSYPRHEYFRRILCNLLGRDVVSGELPHDIQWLGGIIQDICYKNAKAYFGF